MVSEWGYPPLPPPCGVVWWFISLDVGGGGSEGGLEPKFGARSFFHEIQTGFLEK